MIIWYTDLTKKVDSTAKDKNIGDYPELQMEIRMLILRRH